MISVIPRSATTCCSATRACRPSATALLGIGAYAFGLTQFNLADGLWPRLGAIVVTAALGGAVALFISHRRGVYFALMTIAFGQIFFSSPANGPR